MEKILNDGFAALGIAPDTEAVGRLQTYYEYLEERNKVMNLTAINGLEDVARLHFLDCAALLTVCNFADKKVIDVGTGAGFPGLVLKIVQPSMDITLLDSLNKRIDFLGEVGEKLKGYAASTRARRKFPRSAAAHMTLPYHVPWRALERSASCACRICVSAADLSP